MYKLTLYICPIADNGEPLDVSYEGNDLDALKREIDWAIINTMKVHNANDGETYLEMFIEKDGEYYDHDEGTVVVDLRNNLVKYEIANDFYADLIMEQHEQM